MYNGSNNSSAQQVKLAMLKKLAYDPYYSPEYERRRRRRQLIDVARALELGGLAAAVGGQAFAGNKNKTLGKQISTLGRTAMGLGAAVNTFAGNVPEAIVFGGLLGIGGLKNLGKIKDNDEANKQNQQTQQKPRSGTKKQEFRARDLMPEGPERRALNQAYYKTVIRAGSRGAPSPHELRQFIHDEYGPHSMYQPYEDFDPAKWFGSRGVGKEIKKVEKNLKKIKTSELLKLAYNAYVMPDYGRIFDEDEERRLAAKRAWRTYAMLSGLAGAGVIALKGKDKTWANVGRALSASSLAAALGTGNWATAATSGGLWGLGEWMRSEELKTNQKSKSTKTTTKNEVKQPTKPKQPKTPSGGAKQKDERMQKTQEDMSIANLGDEAFDKTAADQIQLIQTLQQYYMLKSAQDASILVLAQRQLVKTAAPFYEGYHPGLYFDEYAEERERKRQRRNLFNALTIGGLALTAGSYFTDNQKVKNQLSNFGNAFLTGGVIGNVFSGNFGSAALGAAAGIVAKNKLQQLSEQEAQGGEKGLIGYGKDWFKKLQEGAQNWFGSSGEKGKSGNSQKSKPKTQTKAQNTPPTNQSSRRTKQNNQPNNQNIPPVNQNNQESNKTNNQNDELEALRAKIRQHHQKLKETSPYLARKLQDLMNEAETTTDRQRLETISDELQYQFLKAKQRREQRQQRQAEKTKQQGNTPEPPKQ